MELYFFILYCNSFYSAPWSSWQVVQDQYPRKRLFKSFEGIFAGVKGHPGGKSRCISGIQSGECETCRSQKDQTKEILSGEGDSEGNDSYGVDFPTIVVDIESWEGEGMLMADSLVQGPLTPTILGHHAKMDTLKNRTNLRCNYFSFQPFLLTCNCKSQINESSLFCN